MSPDLQILFVFLDGVGLASPGPSNPLSTLELPAFAKLAGGRPWTTDSPPIRAPRHIFIPVDANLGVEGLPQSGTGQAALFTGENAAVVHGRHFGPYPPSKVRPVVAERSVFAQLKAAGVPPEAMAFANAYPERFFAALEKRGRWTVTTLAASSAGVRLRRAEDLARGAALAADITGRGWQLVIDRGHQRVAEETAAAHLMALVNEHAFTLFEYFLTDKAGHSQDQRDAAKVLLTLDRFLGAILKSIDPRRQLLLICSDHGNIEDLASKGHTRNPVPLVAWGNGADSFAGATSIQDVTPAIIRLTASLSRSDGLSARRSSGLVRDSPRRLSI